MTSERRLDFPLIVFHRHPSCRISLISILDRFYHQSRLKEGITTENDPRVSTECGSVRSCSAAAVREVLKSNLLWTLPVNGCALASPHGLNCKPWTWSDPFGFTGFVPQRSGLVPASVFAEGQTLTWTIVQREKGSGNQSPALCEAGGDTDWILVRFQEESLQDLEIKL